MSAATSPAAAATVVADPPARWSLHGLGARAGDRPLFAGVSLDVPAGHWVELTGRNGVGKTTLLRILAGLVRPDGGELRLGDDAVDPRDPRWRAELLYIGHAAALKGTLDAAENLRSWLALDHGERAAPTTIDGLLERCGLARRAHVPADRLSAGQRKRVQMARMAASTASLWLLDEPTNALDTDGQELLVALVTAHLTRGGTAVIASHQRLPVSAPALTLDMNSHSTRRAPVGAPPAPR